jgi:hypothetical protein
MISAVPLSWGGGGPTNWALPTYDGQAEATQWLEAVVLELEGVDGGGHLHPGVDVRHRLEPNDLLVLLLLLLLVLQLEIKTNSDHGLREYHTRI